MALVCAFDCDLLTACLHNTFVSAQVRLVLEAALELPVIVLGAGLKLSVEVDDGVPVDGVSTDPAPPDPPCVLSTVEVEVIDFEQVFEVVVLEDVDG